MKRLLVAMLVFCSASAARAGCSSHLVSSADLVGSFPKTKIIGPLGQPLGEYITIEGTPCAVGFGGSVTFQSLEDVSKFGVHSLKVSKVNGVELKTPVIITFARNAKFKPAPYYVVRGYQTGEFGPGDPDPEDPKATAPQTNYQFWIRFVATKDLTGAKASKTNKPSPATR